MKPLPMMLCDRLRPGRAQMSHVNSFASEVPPRRAAGRLANRGGRRIGARRPLAREAVRPAARPAVLDLRRLSRDEFTRRWSLLMIRSFPSREACSVHFEVTFQTACNWFEGHCRPYGDQVNHAWRTLPAYAQVMGEGR